VTIVRTQIFSLTLKTVVFGRYFFTSLVLLLQQQKSRMTCLAHRAAQRYNAPAPLKDSVLENLILLRWNI